MGYLALDLFDPVDGKLTRTKDAGFSLARSLCPQIATFCVDFAGITTIDLELCDISQFNMKHLKFLLVMGDLSIVPRNAPHVHRQDENNLELLKAVSHPSFEVPGNIRQLNAILF